MDHHRLHPTCSPWPESDSAGLSALVRVSGCSSPSARGPPPPPARAAHHWHRWTVHSLDIAGISQTSPPRQAGLLSPPPHRTPVAAAPPRAPFASPPGVSCCERSEGFCHQARVPTGLHLCTVIPLATRCMCMAHRAASVRQFRLPKHAFSASTSSWQGPRQVHWHWQVRCSRAFFGNWLPA